MENTGENRNTEDAVPEKRRGYVYLAAPFFTPVQRSLMEKAARILRGAGYTVYVPAEHSPEFSFVPSGGGGALPVNPRSVPNPEWGAAVFREDLGALSHASAVLALYCGMYSDTGTAWELGAAAAFGIPANVTDVYPGGPGSLMAFGSAARVYRGFGDFERSCGSGNRRLVFRNGSALPDATPYAGSEWK